MTKIYPEREQFNILKEKFSLIPLYLKIKAEEEPLAIYKKFRGENSFILLSSLFDGKLGKYSYIGFEPFLVFKSKGSKITINGKVQEGNPFKILRQLIQKYKLNSPRGNLPLFYGGAVGYFAYDAVHFLEKIPNAKTDDINAPDIYFVFVNKSIIYDHEKNELTLVVLGNDYEKSTAELKAIAQRLSNKISDEKPSNKEIQCKNLRFNFTKEQYINAIKKILHYISIGDTYQVNLSQRLEAEISGDALAIFENLIKINPSPFSAFLDFEDVKIISSSPERLIRLENGIASTRPIAGTRKRGKTPEEDKLLEEELRQNSKENAEHTMLVDLERNDLGKVCDYGTVKVDEIFTVEKYSHVMHLVSNVSGKLHPTKDAFDLFRAMFPGGTITGCPKIRTMEIISEMEPTARGPYTGSLGYFNFSGDMDFNIIIRSIVMKGNKIYAQTGGGIVADSNPEEEYKETLYKLQAMVDAVNGKRIRQ